MLYCKRVFARLFFYCLLLFCLICAKLLLLLVFSFFLIKKTPAGCLVESAGAWVNFFYEPFGKVCSGWIVCVELLLDVIPSSDIATSLLVTWMIFDILPVPR